MTLDKHDKWGMDKNKKKKAPFVAFYDMRAVTFVLPDEMADVMVLGLQWFSLILQLNHRVYRRPSDSHSKSYLHREKNIWFGTRIINLLQSF